MEANALTYETARISPWARFAAVFSDLENWLGRGGYGGYLEELRDDRVILDQIESAVADVEFFHTKRWPAPLHLGIYRATVYALLRAIQPRFAVETGVLHGLTSAFMLGALHRNRSGTLISIDLPSYFETGPANRDGFDDTLPPGREPGWVVGGELAGRWNLRKGRSLDLLPSVLDECGSLGLFVHDSEHTYETMWAELTMVWDYVENSGIVVCDNVACNTSFFDFCRKVDRVPFLVSQEPKGPIRFGLIVR